MMFSHTQELDGEGVPSSAFSFPRLGTKGRLVLLLNWYPHFLDQSYAHGYNGTCICIIASFMAVL